MGASNYQSSQNSDKRLTSEESDKSSDLDARQPIAQATPQSALNVPCFSVVQSTGPSRKLSDLSPFVIEKYIVSLAGQPKSIKKLTSGDLLLEVKKKKKKHRKPATDQEIIQHKTLNCSKGVIRCEYLVVLRTFCGDISNDDCGLMILDTKKLKVKFFLDNPSFFSNIKS